MQSEICNFLNRGEQLRPEIWREVRVQGIKHSFGNDSKSSHPNAEVSKRGHPVLANPTQPHLNYSIAGYMMNRDNMGIPMEVIFDPVLFI